MPTKSESHKRVPKGDKTRVRKRSPKGDSSSHLRLASRMDPESVTLTVRQALFIKYYLESGRDKKSGGGLFDGSAAAARAGYEDPQQAAHDLLKHPSVQAAIRAKLNRCGMEIEELLAREAEVASANMGDFLSRGPRGWRLDLDKVHKAGKMHLIKKLKFTRWGPEVELYSAEAARERLLRVHGAFQTNVNVNMTHRVDVTKVPLSQQGMEFLQKLASGEFLKDPDGFMEEYRSLVNESSPPMPQLIDGAGLITVGGSDLTEEEG